MHVKITYQSNQMWLGPSQGRNLVNRLVVKSQMKTRSSASQKGRAELTPGPHTQLDRSQK